MTTPDKQDGFQWTEALAKELLDYVSSRIVPHKNFKHQVSSLIEEFKSSHSKKEEGRGWEIVDGKHTDGSVHEWREYGERGGLSCYDRGCSIHSVRRLVDNETFSVGDVIEWDKIGRNILAPIENFAFLFSNKNEIFAHNNGMAISLNAWKKSPKKQPVLFTTEDGVEIRHDDKYWNVSTEFQLNQFDADKDWTGRSGTRTFSTKEAAEQYILFNKPLLSLEDVSSVVGSYLMVDGKKSRVFDSFKELAKKKLK